jgi:hypothetical protein
VVGKTASKMPFVASMTNRISGAPAPIFACAVESAPEAGFTLKSNAP